MHISIVKVEYYIFRFRAVITRFRVRSTVRGRVRYIYILGQKKKKAVFKVTWPKILG